MRAWLCLLPVLSLAMVCAGCAGGGVRDGDAGPDSGTMSTGDAGRDAGPISCPAGQHPCGGGCIDDLPNEPENGCRLGCGEPCPSPPDGSPMCNGGGTCGFGCEPPFRQEGMECVCTPTTCEAAGFTCGAPDDGCLGNLDCGSCEGAGICNNGHCECPSDDEEPNDGAALVETNNIASIPDENLWEMTFDQWNLHSASDEDWYRFEVTDTGPDDPSITVTLSNVPMGSDYVVSAYYLCDGGTDESTCTISSPCTGTPDVAGETVSIDVGCSTLIDDSGALFIRVRSTTWSGSCDTYTLEVHSAS